MVAGILTDEWCGEVLASGAGLAPWPGASVTFSIEVTGAPDGKRRGHVSFRDGVVTSCGTNRLADADCTIEVGHIEAAAMLRGELDPNVAFMTGKLKVDGAYERIVFGLKDWRSAEATTAFWRAIGAETDG